MTVVDIIAEPTKPTLPMLTRRSALAVGTSLVAAAYADAHMNSLLAADPKRGNHLMNSPINTADYIPVSALTPFISVSPIVLPVPGRISELQLRVSAPTSGSDLPVILLSHGHGRSTYLSSLRGYGPLADFYAATGFAVIQPTHQDSTALGLDPNGPEGPLFWRSRAQDMHFILDHLARLIHRHSRDSLASVA